MRFFSFFNDEFKYVRAQYCTDSLQQLSIFKDGRYQRASEDPPARRSQLLN